MVLSSSERDDLIRRVERKLGRTSVSAARLREAVDRTLGALPERDIDSAPPIATAVIAAASMPDLASRVRQALAQAGVSVDRLAAATEGRHTVVTALVPAASEGAVRSAASSLGARMTWRREVA